MRNFRLLFLLSLLTVLSVSFAMAQDKGEDFKILAAGNQSQLEDPFVFVARDAKTYAYLQNLVENLPAANTIDFNRNAVVAGFAGFKSSGGWSVQIKKTMKGVMLDTLAPRKGMMQTQIITTPYKVALVPVDKNEALPLDVSELWASKMQTYNVSNGNFEFSGGFAPKQVKFKAHGTIKVLTYGDYVTFVFNLRGIGREKNRILAEFASGMIQKNGNVDVPRLDAGSFSDGPRPPFAVSGTMRGKNLLLNFEPLPTTFADGYAGSGKLNAVKIR